MIEVNGVLAPVQFWECAHSDECCNGCGPKGWGWLIPDIVDGVDAHLACNVHDCCYRRGKTEEDRKAADLLLRRNLSRVWKWHTAQLYYWAVRFGGKGAFAQNECPMQEKPNA
jgi:hypothetical protein